MTGNEIMQTRLECLRLASYNARHADIKDPTPIADRYFEWVMKGVEIKRPGRPPKSHATDQNTDNP